MRQKTSLLVMLLLAVALADCSKTGDHDAYGLTTSATLVEFQTSDPTTITSEVNITNPSTTSILEQIAYRPADGNLYGITSDNYLAEVTPSTGAVTIIGQSAFTSDTLNNALISFDPVADELRVIDTNHNLRISPIDGTLVATGTKVAYASGDVNNEDTPALVGLSYDNAATGATSTTLYALDSGTQDLVRVGNASSGTATTADGGQLTTIGSTGVSFKSLTGFDIEASDGLAYAALSLGAGSVLYTIDLDSGAATEIGDVGSTSGTISSLQSLAIVP